MKKTAFPPPPPLPPLNGVYMEKKLVNQDVRGRYWHLIMKDEKEEGKEPKSLHSFRENWVEFPDRLLHQAFIINLRGLASDRN